MNKPQQVTEEGSIDEVLSRYLLKIQDQELEIRNLSKQNAFLKKCLKELSEEKPSK